MTEMTREEIASNLKERMEVSEAEGVDVDLIGKKYAFVIAMEPEEISNDAIKKLQSVKRKRGLRLMVAIPPKATLFQEARVKLEGTGIGIIDGRGLILKPFSNTRYRSVSLDTI